MYNILNALIGLVLIAVACFFGREYFTEIIEVLNNPVYATVTAVGTVLSIVSVVVVVWFKLEEC